MSQLPPGATPSWWETEYSPSWAAHVVGRWSKRVKDEIEGWEPQKVEITCTACKTVWKGECTSGATRNLVSKFATVHVPCVRDPLETPVVPTK